MIVTLTANPSIDRTLELPVLRPGAVNRASTTRVEAGGKGVNVARALRNHGYPTRAVLPLGGPEGDHLGQLLDALGLPTERVPVAAATRTNLSLVEPDGTVTKVNAPGGPLDGHEVQRLLEATRTAIQGAQWLAVCGSIPSGAPEDLYAHAVRRARDAGIRVAVDTSGGPLTAVLAAAPDVVKPNDEELAGVTGRPLRRLGDVVRGAEELRHRGVGAVLVSLGRHGALLVDDDGAAHARTPPVVPRSNVGAGDATLAGFLAAGGAGREALRTAVAFGAAAARLPGTAMPTPADVDPDAVEVSDVDHDQPLDPEP